MSPLELYFTAFSVGGEGRCQKRDSTSAYEGASERGIGRL